MRGKGLGWFQEGNYRLRTELATDGQDRSHLLSTYRSGHRLFAIETRFTWVSGRIRPRLMECECGYSRGALEEKAGLRPATGAGLNSAASEVVGQGIVGPAELSRIRIDSADEDRRWRGAGSSHRRIAGHVGCRSVARHSQLPQRLTFAVGDTGGKAGERTGQKLGKKSLVVGCSRLHVGR